MKDKTMMKKWISFELNECYAMKEYLEEMAIKGWKLKKINSLLETAGLGKPLFTVFVFEKTKPQKLIYAVEIIDKITLFGGKPEQQEQEYLEYCKEGGWEYVSGYSRVHVFVSEDVDIIPIETDEELKFQTIKKSVIKHNIFWWVMLPLLMIYLTELTIGYFNFQWFIISPIKLLDTVLIILYFLIILQWILRYVVWFILNNRRLKKKKALKYCTYANWKTRQTLKLIFTTTLWIFCCWIMIKDLDDKYTPLVYLNILLIVNVGGILVIKQILNKFAKSSLSTISKLLISISTAAITVLLLINAKQPQLIPPLNMQDFGIQTAEEITTYSSYDSSFFANYVSYSLNNKISDEDLQTGEFLKHRLNVTYRIFESKYPDVLNLIFKAQLNFSTHMKYEKIDMPAWGAESVYALSIDPLNPNSLRDNAYCGFAVYKNRIFVYFTSEPLTNEQIQAIVKKLNLNGAIDQ